MRIARWSGLVVLIAGCAGTIGGTGPDDDGGLADGGHDAGLDASVPNDAGPTDSGFDAGPVDSGVKDSGVPDAGPPDAGPPDAGDFCNHALLCDDFEAYDGGNLANGVTIGPWKVNVQDANTSSATIDATRSISGGHALKIHIDQNASSGAQLKTRSGIPLFTPTRQKLYGRFWMYLGPDGTSVHWTMLGASGTVPQGTTTAGANATYLFSAFNTSDSKNQFSEVYGNSQTGQDCYHGSGTKMPVDRWACISWSLDAPGRHYRMSMDGTPIPGMVLDDEGDGCVNQSNQSWWGPDFSQFYIGALSFHAMTGPMDLWFDDVVVDVNPVTCPP